LIYVVLFKFEDPQKTIHTEALIFDVKDAEELKNDLESSNHVKFTEKGILFYHDSTWHLCEAVKALKVLDETYEIISKFRHHPLDRNVVSI